METVLLVSRFKTTADAYFGRVTLNGTFVCYSMERIAVAIPEGTYSLEMTYSPRFKQILPLIDGVPGRSDIRIHAGNLPSDTEGCILVGMIESGDTIENSRIALAALLGKIGPNAAMPVVVTSDRT